MTIRKTVYVAETVFSEAGKPSPVPVSRVAAIAVISNPCAGAWHANLDELADLGLHIGETLAEKAVALLENNPVAYGKAAIVGVNGDIEHAAAVLHPKLGKPMRAACGGGQSLIPSVTKVAAAGASVDIPLAHKDEIWSFNELDTITVFVADAPRPDEIVAAIAYSDGGRPEPRIGATRAVV